LKYCLTEEKRAFVKALESEPGDRTAFVAKKEERIKARKAVRLYLITSSHLRIAEFP
jgi:hypothetical protein